MSRGTWYLGNAFSVGMLSDNNFVKFVKLSHEAAVRIAQNEMAKQGFVNSVRHNATAKIAERVLGITLAPVVESVKLRPGDKLFVVMPRWRSGRPPETREYNEVELETLCEGIEFWMCEVIW